MSEPEITTTHDSEPIMTYQELKNDPTSSEPTGLQVCTTDGEVVIHLRLEEKTLVISIPPAHAVEMAEGLKNAGEYLLQNPAAEMKDP